MEIAGRIVELLQRRSMHFLQQARCVTLQQVILIQAGYYGRQPGLRFCIGCTAQQAAQVTVHFAGIQGRFQFFQRLLQVAVISKIICHDVVTGQ